MKVRVYFRVEGDLNYLKAFNESLSVGLRIESRQRKKIIKGQVEVIGHYWCSVESDIEKKINILSDLEDYIDNIIAIYFDHIKYSNKRLKYSLVVVAGYERVEEVGGIYLSQKTIRNLSEINCDLDMDADLIL